MLKAKAGGQDPIEVIRAGEASMVINSVQLISAYQGKEIMAYLANTFSTSITIVFLAGCRIFISNFASFFLSMCFPFLAPRGIPFQTSRDSNG